jgi:hypothetical protein
MLVDCERLSGNGRLIDLEESIIGYDAAISRNNSTLKFFLVLHKRYFQGFVALWFSQLTSSICRISPGTTSGASISNRRPSRRTTAFKARVFFNSSTIEPAWNSCMKPTEALSKSRAQMTPKSTQSSRPAASTAAAYQKHCC